MENKLPMGAEKMNPTDQTARIISMEEKTDSSTVKILEIGNKLNIGSSIMFNNYLQFTTKENKESISKLTGVPTSTDINLIKMPQMSQVHTSAERFSKQVPEYPSNDISKLSDLLQNLHAEMIKAGTNVKEENAKSNAVAATRTFNYLTMPQSATGQEKLISPKSLNTPEPTYLANIALERTFTQLPSMQRLNTHSGNPYNQTGNNNFSYSTYHSGKENKSHQELQTQTIEGTMHSTMLTNLDDKLNQPGPSGLSTKTRELSENTVCDSLALQRTLDGITTEENKSKRSDQGLKSSNKDIVGATDSNQSSNSCSIKNKTVSTLSHADAQEFQNWLVNHRPKTNTETETETHKSKKNRFEVRQDSLGYRSNQIQEPKEKKVQKPYQSSISTSTSESKSISSNISIPLPMVDTEENRPPLEFSEVLERIRILTHILNSPTDLVTNMQAKTRIFKLFKDILNANCGNMLIHDNLIRIISLLFCDLYSDDYYTAATAEWEIDKTLKLLQSTPPGIWVEHFTLVIQHLTIGSAWRIFIGKLLKTFFKSSRYEIDNVYIMQLIASLMNVYNATQNPKIKDETVSCMAIIHSFIGDEKFMYCAPPGTSNIIANYFKEKQKK